MTELDKTGLEGPALNTDREIWRERPGDYYADSIHVTASGSIGIDCGGMVYTLPVREWHRLAATTSAGVTEEQVEALTFYAEQWEQDVDAERTATGWQGSIGDEEPTRALLADKGARARAALTSRAPAVKAMPDWQRAFAAQSRKLEAVLHLPGVKEAIHSLDWSSLVPSPAPAGEPGIKAEIFDWLGTELSAIDCWYRGDPSYEHDAYWFKDKALDLVKQARVAFPARSALHPTPTPVSAPVGESEDPYRNSKPGEAFNAAYPPDTVRVCPKRDASCPHGMGCPYVDGYWCNEPARSPTVEGK
ncbi:hypothetical protein CO731_04900 [Aminobacter sp. MSH1]|uniref:hypothetical protein n=1 Tax=Aminobacter sp. MSH1 TaxID=374606 RepID=UPI000D3C5F82|nr:hypothetical protein [Aminobacter sp. MSH1]AWC25405.1 hypothetical protein CO731_04900 [Aminobacter sp. MSH1]